MKFRDIFYEILRKMEKGILLEKSLVKNKLKKIVNKFFRQTAIQPYFQVENLNAENNGGLHS